MAVEIKTHVSDKHLGIIDEHIIQFIPTPAVLGEAFGNLFKRTYIHSIRN